MDKPVPPQGQKPGKADPFDFGNPFDLNQILNYLRIIRERWLWGLATGLVLASLFAFVSLKKVPIYQSAATLLIETRAERVLDVQQVVDTSLAGRGDAELDNHLRQMQSRTFRQSVVASLSPQEQRLILAAYLPEDPGENPPSLESIVADAIGITRTGQIFNITARHRTPEAAQLLANRYAAQYINNILTRTGVGNESAIVFLQEQAEQLRNTITRAERELTDYRRRYNLVSLEETQNIIVQRLNAINSQLTNVRIEQLALDGHVAQVEEAIAMGNDPTEIPIIAEYGAIPQLLARKKSVEGEHAELTLRYLELHPRMIEVDQRLMQVQTQMDREIERAVRDLRNRQESVNRRFQSLSAELARAEQESLALDQQSIEYNVLRRQLDSDRQTFDSLIDRLNETNLAARLNTTNLRILDEAVRPSVPVEPNPTKVAAVTVLLFGMAFIGFPLLIEVLDNRLKSGYDVEVFLGKHLLGDLPYVKGMESGQVSPNVVLKDEDDVVLEAFRGLYSSLQMNSQVDIPKTILITSTRPSEGKSFVSINLAATIAKHGLRVLLMDCDFRRPTLHRHMEMRNDHGMLTWYEAVQTGKESLDSLDVATNAALEVKTIAPGFDFLRSGGSTKRTTELIDSDAFERLLTEVRGRYDVVILDTPPASVFTDSLFLAESADEVLYVCRFNQISRHKVSHFVKRLDGGTGKVTGVIINGRTSAKGMRYGYDYNYSYYSSDYKYYKSYATDVPGRRKKQKKTVPESVAVS